jgi:coenzyme F420-dependent glucose-6-phosphate dehydrogenase
VPRYFLGCMHEQYHPRKLLEQAVAGERAGFDGIACSDHFQPWWEPGHSGQAWVWLGAAAEATDRIPVGPAVTVALKRYHPALIAQGFATLEAMYPGRVFVGLGSGESLNESPFGLDWPSPHDQLVALEEACGLIRRLWDGERVDHGGPFFKTKGARTFTPVPSGLRRSTSPPSTQEPRRQRDDTAMVSGRRLGRGVEGAVHRLGPPRRARRADPGAFADRRW